MTRTKRILLGPARTGKQTSKWWDKSRGCSVQPPELGGESLEQNGTTHQLFCVEGAEHDDHCHAPQGDATEGLGEWPLSLGHRKSREPSLNASPKAQSLWEEHDLSKGEREHDLEEPEYNSLGLRLLPDCDLQSCDCDCDPVRESEEL